MCIVAALLILISCLAPAQDLPPSGRPTPPPNVVPDRQIYVNARSVVDETPEQIIARIPELKDADFSSNPAELAPLLQKIGEKVDALFKDFPNVGAQELVRQRRSNPVLHTQSQTSRRCLYLVSVTIDPLEMLVEEYRSDFHGRPLEFSELQRSFMLTSGYVLQSLQFHPLGQRGCRFRLLGRQRKAPGYFLMAFAQRPEVRGLSTQLNLHTNSFTLLAQGVAWIDPDTYRIVRLWTDLLAPRDDIGILKHLTDTEFGEVHFENIDRPFWLPRQVKVTVQWGGELFTNQHSYSDYKIFSVEMRDGEKKLIKP